MAVMYHKIFEVDPKYVSGGKYNFTPTGNGEMLIASYKGKKYFIKRDMHLRYPDRKDSPAVKEKKLKDVKPRERKQEKLKMLMKGLDAFTDRIVVEEMNFGDADTHFTTVTALIPDVLPDTFKYSSLNEGEFKNLTLEMAKLLVIIHERGVIHGDLKEKNILVKKGSYLPYLIDFDASYPVKEIPEWDSIGGTDGYHSPEVLVYGSDEGAAPSSTITPSVDVFSLGVVIHRWWTGSFPSVDLEKAWVGAAVLLDKKFIINKKFDIIIGPHCEMSYSSLLNWMFAKDPAKRPTAKEVVAVLSDELDVPDEFHTTENTNKFDKELWPTHILVAELDKVANLKKKNVKSFKRINDGSGSDGLKYLVKLKNEHEEILSIDEVCKKGYGKRKNAVIDEPWDEHFIEFESAEVISEKGYAKIERTEQAYKKRYIVITNGGRTIDKSHEWLISEGLAKPKRINIDSGSPWPEDGTLYNVNNWVKLKIKSIKCVEIGGVHAYEILYNDDTKPPRPVKGKTLALMGLLIK